MDKRTGLRRPVVTALFLGATLAALAPAPAQAQVSSEPVARVVADLGRYCTTCWRNARVPADLWTDCTQDVMQRLLERVPVGAWDRAFADESEERAEFLRAIDTVKKRMRRAKKLSGDVELAADPRDLSDRALAEDREAVRRASADWLSPRQQQILHRSFEGWSVNDIATELQMPPARISDEKYKAIHKLRAVLCERERDCV